MAALAVLVAAKLASGVGLPSGHPNGSLLKGSIPPCCGPSSTQQTKVSMFMVLLRLLPELKRLLSVSTMEPPQHMGLESEGFSAESAHWLGRSSQSREFWTHHSEDIRPEGTAVVIDEGVATSRGMVWEMKAAEREIQPTTCPG